MGSEQVVENYGLMGPVKAALESATRYLAAELGNKQIRVNALSPGAMMTRAASGIAKFDTLLQSAVTKAPMHRTIDQDDVGNMAAFLVSDLSKNITGGIHMIDAGYKMMD
jgi:enoyl-[acyl-carrier protein] reductase I